MASWSSTSSILLLVAGLLAPACQTESFFCSGSSDCTQDGSAGTCEASGYCSFPDGECDSGRRYGDLAPGPLAGQCVTIDEMPEQASSTGATVDDDALGSTSAASGIEEDDSTSTGDESSTTSSIDPDGSESSSTTTGDEPQCCDASCSACGSDCAAEVIDVAKEEIGEALAIVAVGERVFWTTGFGTDVRAYDPATGTASRLANLPHTITQITADDAFIYYLNYGEGFVGRISMASGTAEIIADVNVNAPGHAAGYGRLAVDETYVYVALAGPEDTLGGAFRVEKTPGSTPTEIGDFEEPVGIAVDAQAVYVNDGQTGLHRVSKDNLDAPEPLADTHGGPVVVKDGHVFVGSGSELLRVPAEAGGASVLTTTAGYIEEMAVDDTHAYVTSTGNSVVRVALFDEEPPATIASGGDPWGIAVTCGEVFWCDNETRSLVGQAK